MLYRLFLVSILDYILRINLTDVTLKLLKNR